MYVQSFIGIRENFLLNQNEAHPVKHMHTAKNPSETNILWVYQVKRLGNKWLKAFSGPSLAQRFGGCMDLTKNKAQNVSVIPCSALPSLTSKGISKICRGFFRVALKHL